MAGDVRHLSLHVLSIYQRRCVMSTGFDGLVALGGATLSLLLPHEDVSSDIYISLK